MAQRAKIIDVSKWQGRINHTLVKTTGIDAAIVKMSEGTGHKDPQFENNWSGFSKHNMLLGVYHYTWLKLDPYRQVQWIEQTLGGRVPPIVAIDLEKDDNLTKRQRSDNAWIICNELEQRGYNVFVYSAGWYMNSWFPLNESRWRKFPLWNASYTPESRINLPSSWNDWLIWQYTDERRLNGIWPNNTVDMNWGKHPIDWFWQTYRDERPRGDRLREMMLAKAASEQSMEMNWDASLTKAAAEDGFVSMATNEYTVEDDDGQVYVCQAWESPQKPGEHRVYYAPIEDINDVSYFERQQERIAA